MTLRPTLHHGYPIREDHPRLTPGSISGLGLWLDTSAPGTLFQTSAMASPATVPNDPVGAWLDRSGKGRHATQSTATARPLLDTNLRVKFDGIDDFLSLGGGAGDMLRYIAGATLIGVISSPINPAARSRWFHASAQLSSNVRFGAERLTTNTEGFQGRRLDADTAQAVATPAQSFANNILSVVSVVADYAGDTVRMYQNSVAGPFTTAFQTASTGQPLNDTASNAVIIGAASAANYFAGSLAELVVYPRACSDWERRAVEGYLAAKWGVA
jgi:hypothetical protein